MQVVPLTTAELTTRYVITVATICIPDESIIAIRWKSRGRVSLRASQVPAKAHLRRNKQPMCSISIAQRLSFLNTSWITNLLITAKSGSIRQSCTGGRGATRSVFNKGFVSDSFSYTAIFMTCLFFANHEQNRNTSSSNELGALASTQTKCF